MKHVAVVTVCSTSGHQPLSSMKGCTGVPARTWLATSMFMFPLRLGNYITLLYYTSFHNDTLNTSTLEPRRRQHAVLSPCSSTPTTKSLKYSKAVLTPLLAAVQINILYFIKIFICLTITLQGELAMSNTFRSNCFSASSSNQSSAPAKCLWVCWSEGLSFSFPHFACSSPAGESFTFCLKEKEAVPSLVETRTYHLPQGQVFSFCCKVNTYLSTLKEVIFLGKCWQHYT